MSVTEMVKAAIRPDADTERMAVTLQGRQLTVEVDLDLFLDAYAWAAHSAAKDAMVQSLQTIHFVAGPAAAHACHFDYQTFLPVPLPGYAVSVAASDRYRSAWSAVTPLTEIDEGTQPDGEDPAGMVFRFGIPSPVMSEIAKSWPKSRGAHTPRRLRIQLDLEEDSPKVLKVTFTVANVMMVMSSSAIPWPVDELPLQKIIDKTTDGMDKESGPVGFNPAFLSQMAVLAAKLFDAPSLRINLNGNRPACFSGSSQGRWFSAVVMPMRGPADVQ